MLNGACPVVVTMDRFGDDSACPVCKRSTPTKRTWHPTYHHVCGSCGVLFNTFDSGVELATNTTHSQQRLKHDVDTIAPSDSDH